MVLNNRQKLRSISSHFVENETTPEINCCRNLLFTIGTNAHDVFWADPALRTITCVRHVAIGTQNQLLGKLATVTDVVKCLLLLVKSIEESFCMKKNIPTISCSILIS